MKLIFENGFEVDESDFDEYLTLEDLIEERTCLSCKYYDNRDKNRCDKCLKGDDLFEQCRYTKI